MVSKKQNSDIVENQNILSINPKDLYDIEAINSYMRKNYNISNDHMIPKIKKIVLSMRFSRIKDDKKSMESAINELSLIACQKPKTCVAKKSIAAFKVKEGDLVGCMVTLRNKSKMYSFIYKLTHISLPQTYDFRGLNSSGFDKNFNFAFGIKDFLVFPELSYDTVHKIRGIDISIHSQGLTSKEMSIDFMKQFGFPIKDLVFK